MFNPIYLTPSHNSLLSTGSNLLSSAPLPNVGETPHIGAASLAVLALACLLINPPEHPVSHKIGCMRKSD